MSRGCGRKPATSGACVNCTGCTSRMSLSIPRLPQEAFTNQPTNQMEAPMLSVKDMVKDNKQVIFSHYKEGELWYRTEDGFEFPVPVADVGSATMLAQDKALLFMRYIRKHVAMLDRARAGSGVSN